MTSREHRLPGFIELAELGAGAQGEVVLARHESGGGPVAIKYLAAGLLGDTAARNTFRDETQMLTQTTTSYPGHVSGDPARADENHAHLAR